MKADKIKKIIEQHKHWLNQDCDGWESMRADLREADLWGANLWGADLRGADLRGADLRGANLREADLWGANLWGADLWGADLRGADLRGADLRGADLREADIRGAIGVNIPIACPECGEFTAFKKARCQENVVIVRLTIPADAKRTSATGRKCRCNKAIVKSITSIGGKSEFGEAQSIYEPNFVYKVGETVTVENFDENRWNECSTGIHFFITRKEAEEYAG